MATNNMTTKEKIVDEALTLFSTKGFKGTSVKNIADAVGIKDASLYKHYKSKQEILNTIVSVIKEHIEHMSQDMGLPLDEDISATVEIYKNFDADMLAAFSKKFFLFYLKDPYMSRFWRMGNMEQYNDSEVYTVYRKLFLEDSITYQTALFAEFIKQNIFKDGDPQVIAISFYTPIFFLLSKYNNDQKHEEEALAILDKQVRQFFETWGRG